LVKIGADRLRVLIVEDEPIAREILGDLLKMAGYDVLSARTGEQALLTLVQERGRIDCLFTAVELPGLVDGWMLADEFRVADAAKPVVFATRSDAAEARRSREAAFIARPVLPPEAVEAVNEVTGRTAVLAKCRSVRAAEPVAPQSIEAVEVAEPALTLRVAG
jgi:CheY-like chemotaxis protein